MPKRKTPAVPPSNVIPLRPRDQVPRRVGVGRFRRDPLDRARTRGGSTMV
jgi:hypothetical protein